MVFLFGMKLIIAISCVLLFVLIPLGLLMVFGKAYGDGANLPVLIIKLIVSGVIHLASSVLIVIFLVFTIIGPDPKPGRRPAFGEESQLICLLIIAGYGFVGWLLCSFVNGKFIKSYSSLNLFTGKPQSLFSSRHHG